MSRFHAISGEHSRFRRWTLYILARYLEVPVLGWGYSLLRGRHRRLGQNRLVRALLSWLFVAPFGRVGDTGRPTPTAEVLRTIDGLEGSIAVGPCRCRIAHHGCDHPLETDIVMRTGVEAWTRAFPQEYRLIDKDKAKRIVIECQRAGLWQMVFVHCPVNEENEYVICNCCECGCVPYIVNRELGQRVYPLLCGPFEATVILNRCTGHGSCVDVCPFDALGLVDGQAHILGECFGCGRCVAVCPDGAIQMRRRSTAPVVSEGGHGA